MIAVVVVVASLCMVIAQPLSLPQHSALMDVYSGLGCNTTTCRRFALTENCTQPATCSGGNVVFLNALSMQSTGTISSSIGMLTALARLYLNFNQLSGTLTSYIGQLTVLRYLALHTNRLNGTIPKQIAQLKALTHLSLSDNQFTGTIPTQIGQLTALTYFYLSTNQLSGTIPTQFAQLRTLDFLYLYNNRLTGPIPPLSSTFSRCFLQASSNDTNCLDCSTAPSNCTAYCSPRTCPPTPMPLTTTTTTQQTRTSSTTASGMATLSMMGTTSGQIDATQKPSSSEDNTALIGGIVGGAVALLIVVGVISFVVVRNRNAKHNTNQQRANDGHALSPPVLDRIDIPSPSNYSEKAKSKHTTITNGKSLRLAESERNLIQAKHRQQ